MSHHLDGGFSLLVEVKAFLCLVLILSPFRLKQKEVFLCRGQTAVSTCPDTAPYLDMAPPPPSPSNATRPTDAPSVSNWAKASVIVMFLWGQLVEEWVVRLCWNTPRLFWSLQTYLMFMFTCRHVQQLQAETQQLRQRRQERSEEQTEEVHQQTAVHEDSAGERPHQRFLLLSTLNPWRALKSSSSTLSQTDYSLSIMLLQL